MKEIFHLIYEKLLYSFRNKTITKNEIYASDTNNFYRNEVSNNNYYKKLNSFNFSDPIFFEIKSYKDQYHAKIWQFKSDRAISINNIRIGKNERPFRDYNWSLENIVDAIIKFSSDDLAVLDERVQIELGQYIFDETINRLNNSLKDQILTEKNVDIRIIANDEWIACLPWHLIAHRGIFKSTSGWSISISGNCCTSLCELSPSPKILIIAPEPEQLPHTNASTHIDDIVKVLAVHDELLTIENHINIVYSWDEFVKRIDKLTPDIVYYYGHGILEGRVTRLAFCSNNNKSLIKKPITDFALKIRKLNKKPMIVYINCCHGDIGDFLGIGNQLCNWVPVIVSNRTISHVSVAQSQALNFLYNIIIQSISPHQAIARLHTELVSHKLSTCDYRWIAPIIHVNYKEWTANPPIVKDRLSGDPYWELKVDRVSQYNAVIAQTRLMIREKRPKSLIYVWYGQEGQGIELFHKRLLVELRDELRGNTFVNQIRPRWPEHLDNYHESFSDIYAEAFEVNSIEAVPARIRAMNHGRQTLIYVSHEPVVSTYLINPESLKKYVQWWDIEFASKLERKQFALLTVSFIVKNPFIFLEEIEKEKIEELNTKNSVFWLLDEMEEIARKDLNRFLHTHNINLPEDKRDEVLNNILRKTNGKYEQTIEELKKLRKEAWKIENIDTSCRTFKKKYNY